MDIIDIVAQVRVVLQQQGRLSYRIIQRQFALDDAALEDVKFELIEIQAVAVDKDGKMLVWTGTVAAQETGTQGIREPKLSSTLTATDSRADTPSEPRLDVAERRQLTVMFCDLVGSTALSTRLDPEDFRDLVRAYQKLCAEVIQRHDGSIAQYLGDGLLVYFGYPIAHEDDARRAVRTSLEIINALRRQERDSGQRDRQGAWQVRIGVHTGVVVVGEIGAGGRREHLALGETPNIAARLQGLAEPNTVLLSAATHRLVERQFACQPLGAQVVKGLDTPLAIYHVQGERHPAFALADRTPLTPFVGREQEIGLLLNRWQQAKEGRGQVVLLSGEPGIGKSRLASTLKERVTSEGSLLLEARCSPYHQQSALYPLVDMLQRTVVLTGHETDEKKVARLERALSGYGMQDTLPLFTALLLLPLPLPYSALTLTPQKQRERTLQAVLQFLTAQAERYVTVVWEDVHWADPSSVEFLTLLIEQAPTTKLLLVLTFRPEFTPPWKPRSHLSHLVLNRLGQRQVEAMIAHVIEDHALSPEVIEQILAKTDGVPLFVEELTKSVLEAGGSIGAQPAASRPFSIPATLQEALLARLDRLSEARQVAQLAATLGREFSYDLLQAVTLLSDTALHSALAKLVEAEILYHRSVGEKSRYLFKHALIQDTAYHSLLKSTRQQYHQQIAQVLEAQFPETTETQPEVVAQHYTEAGLVDQALPYWQRAGQRAIAHSAYTEAMSHLITGLALLQACDSPLRAQQELQLQLTLGPALIATKGWAAPEVERTYSRAQELCEQVGEVSQLGFVVWGLWLVCLLRAELPRAQTLAAQMLDLAQRGQDALMLLIAHFAVGNTAFWRGELRTARAHLEQGVTLYEPPTHHTLALLYAVDPGVYCLSYLLWTLGHLGYPDQALQRSQEVLTLAEKVSHPHSQAFALTFVAWLHQLRREVQATQECAEAAMVLSTEQGFPDWLAWATTQRGWALVEQGQQETGVANMQQGLATSRATGAELLRPYFLALLAEIYGKEGRSAEGLRVVEAALAAVQKTEVRHYEAELHRLKGELTLLSHVEGPKSKVVEAEECFHKAIAIARQQHAKALELRAVMSLARLWQQQGKPHEAHAMLSTIYNWFTEGLDTKDLQEAKVLSDELGAGR